MVDGCRDHNVRLFNVINHSNDDQVTVTCVRFGHFEVHCRDKSMQPRIPALGVRDLIDYGD